MHINVYKLYLKTEQECFKSDLKHKAEAKYLLSMLCSLKVFCFQSFRQRQIT